MGSEKSYNGDDAIPEFFDVVPDKQMSDETAAAIREKLDQLKPSYIAAIIKIAQEAYADAKERDANEVLKKVMEMLDEHGLDVDELFRKTSEKAALARTGEPVRFRHPNDSSLTWTGRGRLPAWLKEIKENGGDVEKFRIAH